MVQSIDVAYDHAWTSFCLAFQRATEPANDRCYKSQRQINDEYFSSRFLFQLNENRFFHVAKIPDAEVLQESTVFLQLIFERFVCNRAAIVGVGIFKHCHRQIFNLN